MIKNKAPYEYKLIKKFLIIYEEFNNTNISLTNLIEKAIQEICQKENIDHNDYII